MNKLLDEREKILILFDKYSSFLTKTQKQAIHLHLIEDLSLLEVSLIVATTRQSISDAILKGVKKLKNIDYKMNN